MHSRYRATLSFRTAQAEFFDWELKSANFFSGFPKADPKASKPSLEK